MPVRAYDNSLRREQAEATRGRILDAVRDLLVESSTTLSIPDIAARARVSEPTIYRHFPNRDALLEAMSEVVAVQLGAPPEPKDADDLPVAAIAVAKYFGENQSWLRAALNEPALWPLRLAGRRRRIARLRATLKPRLAHLDAREQDIAFAAFGAVVRAETWECLTREFGLSSDEAGVAKSWIARALLDALSKQKQEKRPHIVDADTVARGHAWRRDAPKTKRERR